MESPPSPAAPARRPSWLVRSADWLLGQSALRRARAAAALNGASRDHAVEQARRLIEGARRLEDQEAPLPADARSGGALALYRDAIAWELAAAQGVSAAGPPDLGTLWPAAAAAGVLVRIAGSEADVAALGQALLEPTGAGRPRGGDGTTARARSLAEALLWWLEAPARRIDRLHAERWLRLGVLGVLCLAGALGGRWALTDPDLTFGRPFTLSSNYIECNVPRKCFDLLFHTNTQQDPWVSFDLGAPMSVRRVEVKNRSDCCAERALPLIVEISTDGQHFVEVARRDQEFASWTARFPPRQARYVRLRVPRVISLHLDDVAIR